MHVDVWAHDQPQGDAMQALLTGPLTVELGFAGVGLGLEVVVVRWPYGTHWDADAGELVTAEGLRVTPGTELSLGGGFGEIDDAVRPESARGTDDVFDVGANTVRVAGQG